MIHMVYEIVQLVCIAGGFWYTRQMASRSVYTGPTKQDVTALVLEIQDKQRVKIKDQVIQELNAKVAVTLTGIVKRLTALEESK